MRKRGLVTAVLHKRTVTPGALGGRAERFAEAGAEMTARVLPEEEKTDERGAGLKDVKRIRLITEDARDAQAGDAVDLRGERFAVAAVETWERHSELLLKTDTRA